MRTRSGGGRGLLISIIERLFRNLNSTTTTAVGSRGGGNGGGRGLLISIIERLFCNLNSTTTTAVGRLVLQHVVS